MNRRRTIGMMTVIVAACLLITGCDSGSTGTAKTPSPETIPAQPPPDNGSSGTKTPGQ